MDPDAALTDVRVSASKIRSNTMAMHSSAVAELVDAVENLDEWMSRGGFAPAAWRVAPGRPRRVHDGPVINGAHHGTRGGYNANCRCLLCTGANRLRHNLSPTEIEEILNANA